MNQFIIRRVTLCVYRPLPTLLKKMSKSLKSISDKARKVDPRI